MNQDANLGNEALDIVLAQEFETVLDVGCGMGHQTKKFQKAGKQVTPVDQIARFDGVIETDYLKHEFRQHDVVWCSHSLEHVLETQAFINKLIRDCKDGGIIAITVPPLKHEIVGGHISLWNAGLLLYRLVLSGLDCSDAKVGCYGYNISVVVKKKMIDSMPDIHMKNGDLELLSQYFPMPVKQGFYGKDINVNWTSEFKTSRSVSVAKPKVPIQTTPPKTLDTNSRFEWRETPSELRNDLPKFLFWVKSDTGAWGNWPSNGPIAELFKYGNDWISYAKQRRTAIQAGGNCGMYASWYAKKFDNVHTFEPDPISYKCLRANSRRFSNIQYYPYGLGNSVSNASLRVDDIKNIGVHKIVNSGGISVKLVTIDSLNLSDVDYIHLDVEGYEDKVIEGAVKTIARCRPVIVSEKNLNILVTNYDYRYEGRKHDHVYIPNS